MNAFLLILFSMISGFGFAETQPKLEETLQAPADLEISGTFSVMNPSRLILSSREYKVSYSQTLLGISAFQVGFAIPTPKIGNFQILPFARLGYARNQGTYSLTAQDGTISTAPVTLHWLPLTGGLRTEYFIPNFSLIRPFLTVSGGTEWLNQRGDTLGLNENFWIPFYNVGLGLSFADSPIKETLGFGGFSFSINLQNSLKEDQEARAFSYDLTAHFFL